VILTNVDNVYENRELRTFGHKTEEVTTNWEKLHNEDFISCVLCHLLLRWRRRWAKYVASMEEKRKSYKILVGKTSYGFQLDPRIKIQ
jgi:hypothetical protein